MTTGGGRGRNKQPDRVGARMDAIQRDMKDLQTKVDAWMKETQERVAASVNSGLTQEALRQLVKDCLEEHRPAAVNTAVNTTVPMEEIRKAVRQCVDDQSLITNTPVSAIHVGQNRGVFPTVAAFQKNRSNAESLIDG